MYVALGVDLALLFIWTTDVVLLVNAMDNDCSVFESTTADRILFPGLQLQYNCTIYYAGDVYAVTEWDISSTNHPSEVALLVHGAPEQESVKLGPFSIQATGSDTDSGCYNSTLTVAASPELNGTVISCKQGNTQQSIGTSTINIEKYPIQLKVCPVYNEEGMLQSLRNSWTNLMVETNYSVMYIGSVSSIGVEHKIPSSLCAVNTCSDIYVDFAGFTEQAYAVNVSALSVYKEKSISSQNLYFHIMVQAVDSSVVANFLLLNEVKSPVYCRVDFTGPDGITYTSVSTERGNAGESVTVEMILNGATLLPSTTYSYQATLEDPSDESLCAIITGKFKIESNCNLDSFGASVSDSLECGEGEMAGDIPNGMLCYTGLTPGSTATYSCDKGYELSGTSVLECQCDGAWNEIAPNCVASALVCSLDSLGASVSDSSECGEGEMAGSIPNGMLCYTGLTPGSTATYFCDDGYELSGRSVLVCQINGNWNGAESCFDSAAEERSTVATVVSAVLAGFILLISLTLLLVMIITIRCKKKKYQPKVAEQRNTSSQETHI